MDKIQIECPNCGATLQASQLAEIECPYCGGKFSNPLNEEKDATMIENIIPFSETDEGFKRRLFNEFIESKSIPLDIFENLEIKSLEQYYLPMYLFSGEYSADWSCTVVYRYKDKQGNEYEDCKPTSGVVSGHFSKLTLATNGNDIPYKLLQFMKTIDYTPRLRSVMVKCHPSYLLNKQGENIHVAENDISEDDAWNKNSLQKSIVKDGEDAAYRKMSQWSTEDRHVSVKFRGSAKDLLLMPVWYGKYNYKKEEHYFAMDGQGSTFDLSEPEDKGIKSGVMKRFFIMLGLLVLITIAFHNVPVLIAAVLVFIVLSYRYYSESSMFSEMLKTIKQIGKAQFCNEEMSEDSISSNYMEYKRNNKIITWIAIGLVTAIGIFNTIDAALHQKRKEQIEQTKHEHFEQAVKMVSSPDLFFHTSTEEYGHLRQDLSQQLLEMGFEKEESRYSSENETYTLHSSMTAQTISISLYKEALGYSEYINEKDEIKSVQIKVKCINDFTENFIATLTKCHFVLEKEIAPNLRKKMPYSSGEVYVRVGKKISKEEKMYFNATTAYYADWDAVVVGDGTINLYSKKETQSVSDAELSAGLTFRTFTEKATEDGIVYQSRLAGEQVVKNLKELGFELVKSETKSRYNHIDEVYYDAAIDTYTKTVNGNTTTVIYDEAGSTKIIFPTFDDVKVFENTVKECGLTKGDNGFEDAKEIYWAGTDVYIDGKTVILHYKNES